jgi:hypothetical protein
LRASGGSRSMDQRSGMSLGDDARAAALPALGVSLLRLSVPARLAIAATASCLLWAAVLWALA